MRHTLYLSILVLSLVTACTKEADMNIAKESEHTVKKNLFRVTRIEGHNDHWGDYIWIINYNKEQIESAFHIDTEGTPLATSGYPTTRISIMKSKSMIGFPRLTAIPSVVWTNF